MKKRKAKYEPNLLIMRTIVGALIAFVTEAGLAGPINWETVAVGAAVAALTDLQAYLKAQER